MTKTAKNQKKYTIKTAIVGLFFLLFFSAVVYRSYQLQIVDNAKLINLARSQYKTKLVVNPKRGTIYDRNGEILAQDVLVASIAIHPHIIDDKKNTQIKLQKLLGLKSKVLKKKLASKRKFEWIKRRIPLSLGQKIEKEHIKGVQVLREYRRFYPNKKLAGQLLGAVGYDAKALGGLELDYDNFLKTDTTKKQVQRDARGKLFSPYDELSVSHDVYLTIDKNVQFLAEKILKEHALYHKIKSGFAIVMDVHSGDILAMANYPEFNPNSYWKYNPSLWKNYAVTEVFEPGSTFKAVLMAAALESGKIKAKDKFFCENGSYRIGKNVIGDHHGYGWLTAEDILKVSSNIGVTKIANKIGRKRFYDFIKDMGFGSRTPIKLSGEGQGYIRNYKSWRDIEFSNIAFGQGLSVNGLQMTAAYSAFANGGHLMKAKLVQKIVSSKDEIVFENKKEILREVMKDATTKALGKMLYLVTQPGGTARQAHVPGYLSGGKTVTEHNLATKQAQLSC